MPERDHTVTLRLPAAMHEALRERADAEDRTVSQVLRVAARAYLAMPCDVPALSAPSEVRDA
jgi:hypothetical protein